MTEGAGQNEPSTSSADNAPHPSKAFLGNDGPGSVGLALSLTNTRIHDLDSDKNILREERDLLRLYYTREQAKHLQKLTILGEIEKIKALESGIEKARQDPDSAQSTGSPQTDESHKAEHSLNEQALGEAQSKLQKAFSSLENLCQDDAKWEAQKPSARRWEASRKWQAITPEELQTALEAIRREFEHYGCWRPKQSTMKLCFAALHAPSPNKVGLTEVENLDPYRHFLVSFLGSQVRSFSLTRTIRRPFRESTPSFRSAACENGAPFQGSAQQVAKNEALVHHPFRCSKTIRSLILAPPPRARVN